MEWSIQEVARKAGTTSRTLRHYGDLGLLVPSRVGSNGYRYYDQDALVRLQRILLLRELGLSLPAIKDVLEGQRDTGAALRAHLRLLELEQARIGRQIASVRTTLHRTEEGRELMAEEVFDGFDHTAHEREVTERWGVRRTRRATGGGARWGRRGGGPSWTSTRPSPVTGGGSGRPGPGPAVSRLRRSPGGTACGWPPPEGRGPVSLVRTSSGSVSCTSPIPASGRTTIAMGTAPPPSYGMR